MKKTVPPLRQEDYEALADLRFALRQFMDFSASAAQAEGLPVQQHQALLAIKGQRGDAMTIGMLAERPIRRPNSSGGCRMPDWLNAMPIRSTDAARRFS